MAILIDCARDWTYDMFVEDARSYTNKAKNGDTSATTDRECFMKAYQNAAMRFWVDWMAEHDGKRYDGEWLGDAFARKVIHSDWFSDYYKETYGQRPHLDDFYYVHVLDFPMGGDIAYTFCRNPIEDAVQNAKQTREHF